MRPMTPSRMLEAWEDASASHPVKRPLALLAAACELPLDDLARLPIGSRDQLLLGLRQWAFGTRLECESVCPACGERLEFGLDAEGIRLPASAGTERAVLSADGFEIAFRLPNSADLILCATGVDAQSAERRLLRSCVESACRAGLEVDADALPEPIVEAVGARFAELDPQADVQLALGCPACAHEWLAPFDIASFLWQELCDWSRRILEEIHSLASAYGWSETDILALSPARRAYYLERVST